MKKLTTRSCFLILILAMVVSLFPFKAAATEVPAVASSEFYTHQGETFTTTIYIPDGANIVDFDITLDYDEELITLVEATEHDDIKGTVVFNTETPGKIFINYTRTSKNVTEYLPLVNLTFSVDDNIGVGMEEVGNMLPHACPFLLQLCSGFSAIGKRIVFPAIEPVAYRLGNIYQTAANLYDQHTAA